MTAIETRPRHRAAPICVAAVCIAANAAYAEEKTACVNTVLTLDEVATLLRVDAADVALLAEQSQIPSRRVATSWRFHCQSILTWLGGEDYLRAQALEPAELAGVVAAGTTGAQRAGNRDTDTTPIGEAPEERTAEDVLLRDQRVLLGRGQTVLDFGQFFSDRSVRTLTNFESGVALASVEQEALFSSLQARFGLNPDTEFFVGTTYFTQDTNAFIGNEKIASSRRSDFGSVNLGARRTLKREGPGRPGIIGTLSTSIPTGDTSFAISGGLAFVKSLDPAVLFANINYTHTFSKNFADVALLEPDDRLDLSLGYALALNDTLAISLALTGNFTAATEFRNATLRQQDSYGLRFGLTSWLAPGVYIEPSVNFNLGGPDDGVVFGLTVPYTLGRR